MRHNRWLKENSMLDKSDFLSRYDKHGMLAAVAAQLDRLTVPPVITGELPSSAGITSIVCSAMGGSALPAEFIKDWLGQRLDRPLEVVRGYDLPAYVGETTLTIFASYSGNTEETVSALGQAIEKKASIVVITGGGKLLEMAKSHDLTYFELPRGLISGQAIWAGIRVWADIVERIGAAKGVGRDIEQAAKWMQGEIQAWSSSVPAESNVSKQIAEDLVGHPVVVYAGPTLRYAALRWKIALNEFGKNIAFSYAFPEINHNEMSGWRFPERSGIKVVELQSSLDGERLEQRFDITNRLLSNVFAPIEVTAQGSDVLRQLIWTSLLGEMTGVYLGILNQVDPAELPVVDELKSRLSHS
jgi:glucose/mannose-6-phosphate isomerase